MVVQHNTEAYASIAGNGNRFALAGFENIPWMARGLCQQTDPEAFYPDKGGSTREAKRICHGCPVQAECLDYALEHDERHGIWGGLSERERRKVIKALKGSPTTAHPEEQTEQEQAS